MVKPKLDAIGIVAKDVSASLAFYRLLGIDVDEPEEGDHVEAVLHNGLRLMWDSLELVKKINPNWVEPVGIRMGLAFECGSAAGVDSVYETVVGAGYRGEKEPWDAFWGQRYAQVVDPDGNTVDLFATLES